MKKLLIVLLLSLALLGGCSKNTANGGPTATLALKDGTTITGTVTKSDASAVTIQTPSGVVSTYPVSQISSINYGAAAGPGSSTAPGEPAAAAALPPAAPPPSSAAPATASPTALGYAPAETFRTVPANTTLAIRTNEAISSDAAAPGQTYSGVVARDVPDSSGQVAIPRGSSATLVVRDVSRQGKVAGRSELVLDVAAVRVGQRTYRLETSDFVEKGREGLGANKRTAEFAGGGSLLGTIVGAVAGGGKGAAIGALSGAAAGGATQTLTRGKSLEIPAETVLNFRLEAPIRVREMR